MPAANRSPKCEVPTGSARSRAGSPTLQLQAIEREAPERLAVPSGSRLALTYEVGRPPVLAVRIQELFGSVETPRIAGGRVPVLLHLLAPNGRPQQVTDDLASSGRIPIRKSARICGPVIPSTPGPRTR